MDGLRDVKKLKEFGREQYAQNDTQSANTFIITSSIFLAMLVVRHGWTLVAEIGVSLSGLNVLVGAAIILAQRHQFSKLLDHTMSLERTETDPGAIDKLVNDNSSLSSIIWSRKFINRCVIVGYCNLVISFLLLIVALTGL